MLESQRNTLEKKSFLFKSMTGQKDRLLLKKNLNHNSKSDRKKAQFFCVNRVTTQQRESQRQNKENDFYFFRSEKDEP